MATLYNYTQEFTRSGDGLTYANQLYSMFSRYSNKFSHTEDTNFITIDNRLTLKVTSVDSWTYMRMKIDVWDTENDVSVRGSEMGIAYGVYSIQLYSGEDSLTFKIGNGDYIVIVFKSNNVYFTTDSSRGGPNGIESSGCSFVESSSLDATYHIKKIADYSLSVRDLFFSETCVLVSDGGNYVVVSDYSSCSNVTKFTSLALHNKSYFAIGTNTLIEYID